MLTRAVTALIIGGALAVLPGAASAAPATGKAWPATSDCGTAGYPVGYTVWCPGSVHVAEQGDSLWGLAQAYLGNGGLWPQVELLGPAPALCSQATAHPVLTGGEMVLIPASTDGATTGTPTFCALTNPGPPAGTQPGASTSATVHSTPRPTGSVSPGQSRTGTSHIPGGLLIALGALAMGTAIFLALRRHPRRPKRPFRPTRKAMTGRADEAGTPETHLGPAAEEAAVLPDPAWNSRARDQARSGMGPGTAVLETPAAVPVTAKARPSRAAPESDTRWSPRRGRHRATRRRHPAAVTDLAAPADPPVVSETPLADVSRRTPPRDAFIVGERDGREFELPQDYTAGLILDGPGTRAVARAICLAFLQGAALDQAQVLVTGADLNVLFGTAPEHLPIVSGLVIVASPESALDRLESELLRRSRVLDDAGEDLADDEALAPLLLTALHGYPPKRVAAVLALGRPLGITAITTIPVSGGTLCTVAADGRVVRTQGSASSHLLDATLFTIGQQDALAMLESLQGPRPPAQDEQASLETTPPHGTPAVPVPAVDLSVLGPPLIRVAGSPVSKGLRSKAYELLTYLAIYPEGATTSELVNALWPEVAERRASAIVHTVVANIRQTLRTALHDESGTEFITRTRGRYRIDADEVAVDLWHFRAAKDAAASAATSQERAAALREAEVCGAARQPQDTKPRGSAHGGKLSGARQWTHSASSQSCRRRHPRNRHYGTWRKPPPSTATRRTCTSASSGSRDGSADRTRPGGRTSCSNRASPNWTSPRRRPQDGSCMRRSADADGTARPVAAVGSEDR